VTSANGYLSVVEFLLDNHISTEVTNEDHWQPIHAAASWGHLEVVELLAQVNKSGMKSFFEFVLDFIEPGLVLLIFGIEIILKIINLTVQSNYMIALFDWGVKFPIQFFIDLQGMTWL
jgi:hypothetical protein